MGKGNRQKKKLRNIASAAKRQEGKIPELATLLLHEGSTDSMSPVFSFNHTCKNRCQLEDCTKEELKSLIGTLRKMGDLAWSQVLVDRGLNFKSAAGMVLRLPQQVPPDAAVTSLRVSDCFRLFGHRVGHVYHVIWFDRNHDVVPESKSQRQR